MLGKKMILTLFKSESRMQFNKMLLCFNIHE